MSNFPDRYDGFHTYNRCCRVVQDKGRHAENMKGYTKDRRAYEYWSDGNIHAANMFMGSQFFAGASADHIGPISLGFVHDSHYLQRMDSGANSSKRDRLSVADIDMVLAVYKRTGVYPMSWYSKKIWEFIVSNYKVHPALVPTVYRDMLKQNMVNFMFILGTIIEKCGTLGELCLIECFLQEKSHFFDYSYSFDSTGRITEQRPRHFTGRNAEEMERYKRIAIEAVIDFNDKDNRNTDPTLTAREIVEINRICSEIKQRLPVSHIRNRIERLMLCIQARVIDAQN
jgi:Alw26I/Eco31I/Esp3I family type II restriction endonuclease